MFLLCLVLCVDPLAPPDELPIPVQLTLKQYRDQAVLDDAGRNAVIAEAAEKVAYLSSPSLRFQGKTPSAQRKARAESVAAAKKELAETTRLIEADVLLHDIALDTAKPKAERLGFLAEPVTVQSIADGNVFARCGNHECVIVGLNTSEIADGETLKITELLECVGTNQYPGGRTLWTYRVGPTKELREWQAARVAAYVKTAKATKTK